MSGGGSGVIEVVATSTVANTVCLSFIGTDGSLLFTVGDLSAGWNLGAFDEKNGVSAGDSIPDTLCESADVVGHAGEPKVTFRSLDELAVVERGARGVVDDCIGAGGVAGLLGLAVACGVAVARGVRGIGLN